MRRVKEGCRVAAVLSTFDALDETSSLFPLPRLPPITLSLLLLSSLSQARDGSVAAACAPSFPPPRTARRSTPPLLLPPRRAPLAPSASSSLHSTAALARSSRSLTPRWTAVAAAALAAAAWILFCFEFCSCFCGGRRE